MIPALHGPGWVTFPVRVFDELGSLALRDARLFAFAPFVDELG